MNEMKTDTDPIARIPWDGRDGEDWRLSIVMCTDWNRAPIVRFVFDERGEKLTAEALWYENAAPPLSTHDHESEQVTVITETIASFRRKAAGLPCFEKTLEDDRDVANKLPPEEGDLDADRTADPAAVPEMQMM